MNKIGSIDKILTNYPDWNPGDVAFFKKIEWSSGKLLVIACCQLRNGGSQWPDMTRDFFEITFEFENVSSLNLHVDGNGLHQISGFDIQDVSEDGWEGINFKIEDYENGTIEFNCKSVEVIGISDPVNGSFYERNT